MYESLSDLQVNVIDLSLSTRIQFELVLERIDDLDSRIETRFSKIDQTLENITRMLSDIQRYSQYGLDVSGQDMHN